jgi:N-formylglutamate amidohydrolase
VELFQSAWTQAGAVGLLALVVLLVVTGRLIPRSVAKDRLEEAHKSLDQANHTAELWQQAAAAGDQRADLAVKAMLEQAATSARIEALLRTLVPGKDSVT